MIGVGMILQIGSKIIYQHLGGNFHPPPGGIPVREVVSPPVTGFPGDLALLQRYGGRMPLV